ncbi:hypothetical protein [Actinomadura sp. 7K507]|uniref:hypothetical protein n=1 Tax=Actinomadura sp. 7K507 TaxID=2530365 RepID=UPI0010526123|nr:hypothetical protein [Actinomadura sp. 7K507]TDC80772.1 hypothetical protein E1285_34175 [Actinomadura sp. 7K507]
MNAADHLNGLVERLVAAGWVVRCRYDQGPVRLHVTAPDRPGIGESVRVKAGVGGVPWFIDSTGDPVRPCHDLAGTVAELGARLDPVVMATALAAAIEEPQPRLVARLRALARRR